MRTTVQLLSRIGVAFVALSLATPAAPDEKPRKPKKPALELRASPRYAFSPADILFTAELRGGDDSEEYYCPLLEWEWGDGTKSEQEADCDPWTTESRLERRFTTHHRYPDSGLYKVRVTLRKANRSIATQTVEVTVRPGAGEQRIDPGI